MVDIIHRVGIAASAEEVYKAVTTNEGLSRWWTTDTSGAGSVGSIIKFRFGGGGPDFEVVELQTNAVVRWRHSGEMPGPWIGTEAVSYTHLTLPTICFKWRSRGAADR